MTTRTPEDIAREINWSCVCDSVGFNLPCNSCAIVADAIRAARIEGERAGFFRARGAFLDAVYSTALAVEKLNGWDQTTG